MHSGPPYDARAVANWLLDLADQEGLSIQPLALQKLLYFAHGFCLIRLGHPLTRGHFEAWHFGPVHPAVYQAFKHEGDRPITSRAVARDVISGQAMPLPKPEDAEVERELREVVRTLGRRSAGHLVDLTHAPDGPWAFVVNKAKTSVALGLRIPDNVTVERFRFQKVSVRSAARVGEPHEDAPLVGDRPSANVRPG